MLRGEWQCGKIGQAEVWLIFLLCDSPKFCMIHFRLQKDNLSHCYLFTFENIVKNVNTF